MSDEILQAPFPYFGGKSRVAGLVWPRFAGIENYVEPFFGSGAMLLLRPDLSGIETVNDLDAYVANFWRAVKADPESVASLMNDPVNETDLEARHKWLVTAARKREHAERMRDNPDYFDAKIAAWWCWGLCAWIGAGWCSGEWNGRGGENSGRGVNVRDEAHGGKLPHLGNAGQGECERRGEVLCEWMRRLADRFRNVRVCCGDWLRACASESTTTRHGVTGVFLDPPYLHEVDGETSRDGDIYSHESADVAHAVREWAIENGKRPDMRIALCGYEGEHAMPDDWETVAWKAHGGYAFRSADPDTRGKANSKRERIWFSPACKREPSLFDRESA